MILPYESEEIELHLCKEETEAVIEVENAIISAFKRIGCVMRALAARFQRA